MYNKKILKSKIITIIIASLFLHITLPLSAFAEEEITLDESFTVLEEQEAVTEVDLIETDEISSEEIVDEIVEEPESDEIVEEIEDMIEETSLSEEEALDEETIESKVEETLVEEPESDETVEEIEDMIEETSSSEEEALDEEIIESKVEEVLVEETESSKVEEVIDKIASLSEAEEVLDEIASPSDIKEATTSNVEEIIQLEVTVNTLIGTWTIDGITSYRFDIDGNGAMILPSHSYSFEYELESDNLLLRFEDSRIEDAAFTPSIEDDVLILEKKQELGVSKYKLSKQ